jgi:putative DNA methylase
MSVSKTKSATTHPMNLDAIIVCKKQAQPQLAENSESTIWSSAREQYQRYCARLGNGGRVLSQNGRYVILSSQILVSASLAGINKAETQQLLANA